MSLVSESHAAELVRGADQLSAGMTRLAVGLDQGREAVAGYEALDTLRQGWMTRFEQPDFAALASDHALMAEAMPAAARLFGDSCAACHGS